MEVGRRRIVHALNIMSLTRMKQAQLSPSCWQHANITSYISGIYVLLTTSITIIIASSATITHQYEPGVTDSITQSSDFA